MTVLVKIANNHIYLLNVTKLQCVFLKVEGVSDEWNQQLLSAGQNKLGSELPHWYLGKHHLVLHLLPVVLQQCFFSSFKCKDTKQRGKLLHWFKPNKNILKVLKMPFWVIHCYFGIRRPCISLIWCQNDYRPCCTCFFTMCRLAQRRSTNVWVRLWLMKAPTTQWPSNTARTTTIPLSPPWRTKPTGNAVRTRHSQTSQVARSGDHVRLQRVFTDALPHARTRCVGATQHNQ